MFKKRRLAETIARITAALSIANLAYAQTENDLGESLGLEEIIVTANRRMELVQDIPYNISAISGDTIEDAGIADLTELGRFIPGITVSDLGSRSSINSSVIMRGINANDIGTNAFLNNLTAASVATYLGNTPLFFNLKLSDIERVEVLRGPQGTLYGSGSVGGALRFVYRKPNDYEQFLRLSAGCGQSSHSDEHNYDTQAVFNVPLKEGLALRGFLGVEQYGGVTDATNLVAFANGIPVSQTSDVDSPYAIAPVKEDVDDTKISYGKLALWWQIDENTEFEISYHLQSDRFDGSTARNLLTAKAESWEDTALIEEPIDRDVDMLTMELSRDFGFASFTYSGSRTTNKSKVVTDGTGFYNTVPWYLFFPRMVVDNNVDTDTTADTHELRMASDFDGQINFVAGLYFQKEKSTSDWAQHSRGLGEWMEQATYNNSAAVQQWVDYYYYLDISGNEDRTVSDLWGSQELWNAYYYNSMVSPADADNLLWMQDRTDKFEDFAVYGEVTFQLSDEWQLTTGLRWFEQTLSREARLISPFWGSDCSAGDSGCAEFDNEETYRKTVYKLNTSYDLTEDTMLYATRSQGFRRGGANTIPGPADAFSDPNFPQSYDPDFVTNNELGIKGFMLGRQISYTATVYRMDWDDIQLDTFSDTEGYQTVINGKQAQSDGMEFEINAQLSQSLVLSFGYGYTKAEISKDTAIGYAGGVPQTARSGDPLPGAPKHQASVTLDYSMPLNNGLELIWHLDSSYTGSSVTGYNRDVVPANYHEFDGYSLWNLSLTLTEQSRWWTVLYVKNLFDEEALGAVTTASANLAANDVFGEFTSAEYDRRGFVGRPRTIGLRVSYQFGGEQEE